MGVRERFARYVERKDDAALERRFGARGVQRALLAAMARGFDPARADGFEGTIEYVLLRPATGKQSHRWTLICLREKSRVTRKAAAQPSLTVRMQLADFIRVGAGAIDATEPLLTGRATFSGDLQLAGRLPEMFGI